MKSQRNVSLPVLSDVDAMLRRLELEEQALLRELAESEGRLRRFEEQDKPAYENWLRLEFGPKFSLLEEVLESIRLKRLLVHRIETLIEEQGLHPREALYLATVSPQSESPREEEGEGESSQRRGSNGWDADEIEARRRARREAKREARREAMKEKKREKQADTEAKQESSVESGASTPRRKLVSLYRMLARKLHPDSAEATVTEKTQRLWLEVQGAYESGDYERLLAVAAWLGAGDGGAGEALRPKLSLAEKLERHRMLRKSVSRLARELSKRTAHPAWAFTEPGISRGKLRKSAAREIDEELGRLQEALSSYDDFIDSIGPPRPPRRKGR